MRGSLRFRLWGPVVLAVAGLMAGQVSASAAETPVAAAMPRTPQQAYGSLAGQPHQVSSAATAANESSKAAKGYAQGRVKGAVGAYQLHGRAADPQNSGSLLHQAGKGVGAPRRAVHGFSASTSVLEPQLGNPSAAVYKNADGTFTAHVFSSSGAKESALGGAVQASYVRPASDPTGQGTDSGGTYVDTGDSANHNGDGFLYIGQNAGHTYNSFLQFSGFGSQFANDYIISANLWLDTVYSGVDSTNSCSAQPVDVSAVTQSWNPATIDSYPGPKTGPQLGSATFDAGVDCSDGRSFENIPLPTATLMNWAHGWSANNGLAITAPNTTAAYKQFDSTTDYLSVEYSTDGASYGETTYASPWNNKTGWAQVTLQNQGTTAWTPSSGYKLGYEIYTVSSAGARTLYSTSNYLTAMPSTVNPDKSVTVTATLPSLPVGPTYQVCWDMTDSGQYFSALGVPQTCYALPVVNNPPIIDSFQPGNNATEFTLTPTLSVSAHDPDDYPGTGLSYSFAIYPNGSTTALSSVSASTSASWVVPSGLLSYGSTYYWTAQVSDGQAASAWSQPDYFTVPSPAQPLVTTHLGASPYESTVKGIDPALGDFSTQATDLSLPTSDSGPQVSIQRTYNSLDPRITGYFGAGWSSLLDMRLTTDSDGSGNVVITLADGRQERFGLNGNGSYTPPEGVKESLVSVAGALTLIDSSGTRYTFSGSLTDPVTGSTYSSLSSISDAAGETISVYDYPTAQNLPLPAGGTVAVSGLPATLQDSWYSHTLTFEWGVQPITTSTGQTVDVPHITQVSAWEAYPPSGQSNNFDTWNYNYNASNQLTAVCPPVSPSNCTQYSYTSGSGSGSHFSSMVLDSNPSDYWSLGDAAGSGTAADSVAVNMGSQNATANNVTFGQQGPLAGTPATSASFDGTNSSLTLPPGMINSDNLDIGMWFKTTQAGGTLFSYQSGAPGTDLTTNKTLVLGLKTATGYPLCLAPSGYLSVTAVCDNATAQQWTTPGDGTIRNSGGLCLDVTGDKTASGSVVGLYTCTSGAKNQQWTAGANETWKNPQSGLCLNDPSNNITPGEQPMLYACPTAAAGNSSWTPTPGSFVPALYVGTDHLLHAEFWDGGGVSPMVSTTAVDNGKWHYVVLSGSANSQTLYLDGVQVATRTHNTIQAMDLGFDTVGAGQLTGWADAPSANPFGYFSGQIANVSFGQHPLGLPAVQQEYGSGTTAVSELTGITLPSGKTATTVAYNTLTDRATMVTDNNGGTYTVSAPSTTGTTNYYRGMVASTRPTLDYPLNEPSGIDAADQYGTDTSPGGSDDGVYNNVTLGEPGIFGANGDTAAGFDGASSYLSLPNGAFNDSSGSASVALWFNTKTAGGTLFSYQSSPPGLAATSSYTPALYIGSDGKLHGEFWDGSGTPIASTSAVDDGNWHLAVLTASGTTQTLWVDGQKQATRSGKSIAGLAESLGQTYTTVGAGELAGSWPDAPSGNPLGYFNGEIAQVGLYALNIDNGATTNPELGLYRAKGPASGLAPTTTVTVTDPAQNVSSTSYDASNGNRIISSTDAGGHTTTYAYDELGFQDAVTDPDGHATTSQHDQYGNVLARTSCQSTSSCQTTYYSYYENASNPVDPSNGQVLYEADGRSGPTGTANPAYRTAYTYTSFGALATETTPPTADYPDGRITTYRYTNGTEDNGWLQPANLLASVTDPMGHVTRYIYNSSGQQVEEIDPNGLITYTGRDPSTGVLLSTEVVSDSYPNGLTTRYTYDADLRPLTETDPPTTDAVKGTTHTRQTTVVYDLDGNVTSEAVADLTGGDPAQTTKYGYDSGDRLASVTDPDNHVTSYTYDAFGNKQTVTNGDSTTYSYTYSPTNQLLTTTLDNYTGDPTAPTAATNLQVESRAYDPAGRLSSVTDAMGRTTEYTYFDDNLLQSVTAAYGTPNQAGVDSYTYDAAGNTVSDCAGYTAANGCAKVTDYTVDAADRPTQTTVDPTGVDQVTSQTFDADGDVLDQTVTGSGADRQTSYSYDDMGNRVSQSVRTDNTSPTAFWPLNDGGTTQAADASGVGNPATLSGGVSWTTANGGSALFDGASGSAATTAPVINTTQSFTVSAWVDLKSASTTADEVVLSQDATSESGFYLEYDHTTKSWAFVMASKDAANPTFTVAASPTAAQTGVWTQLTATYTQPVGSTGFGWMELYVNGAMVSGVGAGGPVVTDTTPIASNGGFAIGRGKYNGASGGWFNGQIRGVTSYLEDLTDAQVTQLYTLDPEEQPTGLLTNSTPDIATGELAGYWPLTDGVSAAAQDDSGGGNPGTVDPSVLWSADHGGSAILNGTGGITVPDSPVNTSQSFSVSAWAKPKDNNGDYAVAAAAGSESSGFLLRLDKGSNWKFAMVSADTASPTWYTAQAGGTPQTGVWTHLVGTFNASTGLLSLYINGQLAATATDPAPWKASGPFAIGYDWWGGKQDSVFQGSLSDVQTYNRVLGASEVSTLYTKGGTAGTAPLTTTWKYDERGLQTGETDPRGNLPGASAADYTTSYSYDPDGRLYSTVSPPVSVSAGGGTPATEVTTQLTGYNTFGEPVETQDADGNITTTSYDGDGDVSAVDYPAYTPPGASTPILPSSTFGYDGMGQVTSETDGNQNTASFQYDQFGHQVQETLPGSLTWHVSYDYDGEKVGTTDPTGAQTQATYDALGQEQTSSVLVRQPTPAVDTTQYSYDALGNLQSTQDPDNHTTKYTYDALGDRTSVTDALTQTTTYGYNALGEQTSMVNPDRTSSTETYDDAGRETGTANLSTTGAVLSTTSAAYDAAGNEISQTDADNATTTTSYDALNRVISQNQPAGTAQAPSTISTSFTYDAAGHRTSYTDPNQNVTLYTYNPLGSLETSVAPATAGYTTAAQRTTTFGYDALGHLVNVSRPGGVGIADTYNALGELTQETGSGAEAASNTRSYGYDNDERVTSATAGGSTQTYTYDDRGLLLSSSGSSGNDSYSYDPAGLMSSRTDAAGTASFSYTPDEKVYTESEPLTGTQLTYNYNSLGQPSSIDYGTNGAVESYGYNGLHQQTSDTLTSASGSTLASVSQTYNLDGQTTGETTTGTAGAGSTNYGYDQAGRLTSATTGGTTTNYGYDPNGNLTSAGNTTSVYNAQNQVTSQTTGSATTTYSYTARGTTASVTSGSTTTPYTYDAYDEQTGVGSSSYSYDALGRLATASTGGTAYTFSYDGQGATMTSDGAQSYSRGADGQLVATSAGGTASLVGSNQHGDVTSSFTSNGSALSGSTAYAPYGQQTATSGTQPSTGYQGGWTDPTTSQVYADSRWYSPTTGGFTSADTQSNAPSPAVEGNQYAYADDDPLDRSDISGHDSCDDYEDEVIEQEEEAAEQKEWAQQEVQAEEAELGAEEAEFSAEADAAQARNAAEEEAESDATAESEAETQTIDDELADDTAPDTAPDGADADAGAADSELGSDVAADSTDAVLDAGADAVLETAGEEILEGAIVLALFATTDACGPGDSPEKPTNGNPGRPTDPASNPTEGTGPSSPTTAGEEAPPEDPTAQAASEPVSSSAATDTDVTTSTDTEEAGTDGETDADTEAESADEEPPGKWSRLKTWYNVSLTGAGIGGAGGALSGGLSGYANGAAGHDVNGWDIAIDAGVGGAIGFATGGCGGCGATLWATITTGAFGGALDGAATSAATQADDNDGKVNWDQVGGEAVLGGMAGGFTGAFGTYMTKGLTDGAASTTLVSNIPGILVGTIVPAIDPISRMFPWPPGGQGNNE